MVSVLVFAVALLVAVLVSGLAARSVLSTAVLFLAVGMLVGRGGLNLVKFTPSDPTVLLLVELALFSVLFTDGMNIGFSDLREGWHSPGRALFFGMPLTLLLACFFAHYLLDLNWMESLLVGAALSPTDAVLSAAIVGRREIPGRLRHLLNVESGVNDGLAFPIVLILLAELQRESVHVQKIVLDLVLGVLIGIAVPLVAWLLEKIEFLGASTRYQPLNLVAVGMLVFAICKLTNTSFYLGGFAAGVTAASLSTELRDSFRQFGVIIAELLKLAALFVFGALILPARMITMDWLVYVFVVLMLVAARPLAIELSLVGSSLDWRERLTAAWFGPKGFASVIFGIMILQSGTENSLYMARVIALVVTVSIIAHSSTDVLFVRWFNQVREQKQKRKKKPPQYQPS